MHLQLINYMHVAGVSQWSYKNQGDLFCNPLQ